MTETKHTYDIKGRLIDHVSEFAIRRPEQAWHIEADFAAGEYLLVGEVSA